MPERQLHTAYPVIDTDPHTSRVIRYFRASDYAVWAAATAAGPAFIYGFEKAIPSRPPGGIGYGMRFATVVGATAGFMLAYQRSSLRFWGWTENSREYESDKKEMKKRLKEGKPLYGNSTLDPFYQEASARNSRYAALKFAAFPYFNFAQHNSHGVDPKRYEDD